MKFPVFLVFLLFAGFTVPVDLPGQPARAVYPEVERVVVVGDVHGDHAKLEELLTVAGIINNKGRWIAGDTHLVQMGDLPDRGNDTRKVVEFLRKLEKDARRRGGQVHILIGNHDAMNVYGDLRYVTEGEYREFAGKYSRKRLEALYENEKRYIQENFPEEQWPPFEEGYREEWFAKRPPGYVEHRMEWEPGGDIGRWILGRNTVLKIGRTLFVHAGIGPAHADWTIDTINEAIRQELVQPLPDAVPVARNEQGPLWYRGLALNAEYLEAPHLQKLLDNFEVDRIVVGHTVTGGVILPRFDGKVVLVDVGLSSYFGDNSACLIIDEDQLVAQHRNGRLEIPVEGGSSAVIQYLQQAAKLEPGNRAIPNRIAAMRQGKLLETINGIKPAFGN